MRESWQPWDVSVGFRRPSSPYKALEICVKRFSEYLAYEILHRPDSCKCVCIFIFFHLPDSRLSVLNGLHLYFWLRGSENQEFSTNGTTQTAELTVLNTRLDSCWPLEWKRFITWINELIIRINFSSIPEPDILSVKSLSCGRAIKTEWKWIATEMEIHVVSWVDKESRRLVFRATKSTSYIFEELMSNTEYQVWLRGINFKERLHCDCHYGYCFYCWDYNDKWKVKMSWKKIQITTLAGIICT